MAKPIPGFENYQIDEDGNVFRNGRKLKPFLPNSGYYEVNLCRDNKVYPKYVHRLVAMVYVPNPDPDRLKYVNHKDETKLNNNKDNLEWCTAKYNAHYGSARSIWRLQFGPQSLMKPVQHMTVDGSVIAEYGSVREAAMKTGLNVNSIYGCCRGHTKTLFGKVWRYKEVSDGD